jgi:hypothetical protein
MAAHAHEKSPPATATQAAVRGVIARREAAGVPATELTRCSWCKKDIPIPTMRAREFKKLRMLDGDDNATVLFCSDVCMCDYVVDRSFKKFFGYDICTNTWNA